MTTRNVLTTGDTTMYRLGLYVRTVSGLRMIEPVANRPIDPLAARYRSFGDRMRPQVPDRPMRPRADRAVGDAHGRELTHRPATGSRSGGWRAAVVLLLAGCAPPPEPPESPDIMHVWVFFTRDEEPHPVLREIPRRPEVLTAALEQLSQGPTAEERAAGISSWFSSETAGMLRHVSIDEHGFAIVDFEDFRPIIPGASTSFGSRILVLELNSTVSQFETVRSVEYRIEGSCEVFWNFLQTECQILRFGN